MAASTTIYNLARQALLQAGINFTSDTIKVALCTSSYTPSQSHQYYSNLTNEVSSTNTGYTTGGATLGGKSLAANGNTYTARASATQWTAGSANLTARYAIVYKDTGTGSTSPLICYVLLDTTPADVTATSGGTFTITWDATNGIFYV
jgi:hypothetical protein